MIAQEEVYSIWQSVGLSLTLSKNSLGVTKDVLGDLYTKGNSAQTMLCKKRKQSGITVGKKSMEI